MKQNENLIEALSFWGNYVEKEKCLYLHDNSFLNDQVLRNILKEHKIKIQLDLFS